MPQLFKMVNGEQIPLTEEEVLEFEEREQEHIAQKEALALVAYKEQRRLEYPKLDDMLVAIVEKEEGRPEAFNSLMVLRQQIKNKYPKPV